MEDKTKITSNVDNLELLCEETDGFSLPLRRKGFDQDKDFIKFIKNVERAVRNSNEYRDWTSYLKDVLCYNSCVLSEEKNSEVTVETHHHPISLYVITKGVIIKMMNYEKEFSSFDVAQEVLDLHFQNRVGYTLLASTYHEKYHNGFLEIPIELCHGDFHFIINEYPMDDVDREIIQELILKKMEDIKVKWVTRNDYPGVVNQ